MRKLCRCLTVLVVLTLALTPGAYAADLAERNQEIAALYERVSVMPKAERVLALARTAPEVEQALWIVNMRRVMAEHPELTPEQRSVFYESIGLTQAGYVEIMRGGTEEQKAAMRAASDHLLGRAQALLPAHLIREAFFELGAPSRRAPDLPRPRTPGEVRAQFWNCDCNNETYNGCGMSGYCVADGWSCIPTSGGCGYLGMYGCNGLCT